jgi:hypothetical protein
MVPDTPSTSNGSDTTSRLAAGAVAGVVTYGVGYVLTYLLTSGDVRESGLARITEAVTGDEVVWQIVGWLFYNAHFASTLVDVDVPLVGGSSTVNFIAESAAISALLYAVPALLLVAAGIALARRHLTSDEPLDAARTGALVVVGYLPLAIVGTFLFRVSAGGSSAGPDLIPALALAGVAYPLVFGALGGLFVHVTE